MMTTNETDNKLCRPVRAVFKPGSIGWFIAEFLGSRRFKKLAKSTQRGYRITCDLMRDQIGVAMLHDATPQMVDRYSLKIAKLRSPCVADLHTTLLANLWEFAKGYEEFERGDRLSPMLGRTRHYERDPEGHLAWPQAVIEKYDSNAKPHLTAFRMALHYTGQRGCDVVRMKWSDYDGEMISVVQEKTGEHVWIPCHDELRALFDRIKRRGEFIFVNCYGKPYASSASLAVSIKNRLHQIKEPDYSMHGLRKNAGICLAEAGCSVPMIMAILGHRSPKMAIFYVQQADKKRLARDAMKLWNNHSREEKQARVADRRSQIKPVRD